MQEAPPPLGPLLRYYGPHLVILALTGAALLWVNARTTALESRVAALEGGAPRPPAEDPAATTCAGTLEPSLVLGVIGRQGRGVLACIDASVARRPDLRGTLQLRLRVDAGGHVAGVTVDGVLDDALTACVASDALAWTFPPPQDGACAIVEAPFAVGG